MITANELKIKGIKALEEHLKDQKEIGITVRGKTKYVAMTIEQYDYMREIELTQAYEQVMKEVAEGKYVVETASEHIARIWPEIKPILDA